MSKLAELRGKLDNARARAKEIIEAGGEDLDLNEQQVHDLRTLNEEMDDLHAKVVEQQELEAIKDRVGEMGELKRPPLPVAPASDRREQKSIGELFVESDAFKSYKGGGSPGPVSTLDLGLDDLRAATFLTSSGWAPESLRTGHVEYIATRPAPHVTNYWPEYATGNAAVKYMEETTFTNAAAETAEAGAYAAATLILTERSVTVRKIAVFLPVTDEQLEDEAEARSYIDNRLVFMLQQRLDSQLLVGDGTGSNLTGTENVSGIQTQALGTDPIYDAAFKLFRQIRDNGFAEPSVAFIAPSKWQTVVLTRTADGVYIYGNPVNAPATNLWGVPIVQTVAGTATKLTAGDYTNFAGLYVRRGVDVQVGYNNDDFTKGQISIRADVRVAAVHFRPKAFGVVTGL